MFRTNYLIVAFGLPLLISCDDDASAPSAPTTAPSAQSTTSALAKPGAVSRTRFQVRQFVAETFFSEGSDAGCVLTDVLVFAAERAERIGPGKPQTGPLVFIDIDKYNLCTEKSLRRITGSTREVTFQGDRTKLSQVVIRATIPAADLVNNVGVQVEVDLTWTAIGPPSFQASRSRDRRAFTLASSWLKGIFRDAIASGTVNFDGETLVAPNTGFGQIYRARFGEFHVERTR